MVTKRYSSDSSVIEENEVISATVEYLEEDHEIVRDGEIPLAKEGKKWRADIVCKDEKYRTSLAIECKGGGANGIRKAIGQALSFHYLYTRTAGISASFKYDEVKRMIRKLPLHGFDYQSGQIEHFTTPDSVSGCAKDGRLTRNKEGLNNSH